MMRVVDESGQWDAIVKDVHKLLRFFTTDVIEVELDIISSQLTLLKSPHNALEYL